MSVKHNSTVLPNGQVMINLLGVDTKDLKASSTFQISGAALRTILSMLVMTLPFDDEFYATTYPDLEAARQAGRIKTLHAHFLEHGYVEGRLGAKPAVDPAFYIRMYPDVAKAMAAGQIGSAFEHYVRAGATEGRFANATDMEVNRIWRQMLQTAPAGPSDPPARGARR